MRTNKKRSQFRDGGNLINNYLEKIAKIPLISPEEEAELAKRIKEGDEKALEKLVKANLRFVVSVAKKYQYQGLPLIDLIDEGNIGLIKAAKRFDGTRGFKFISYAVWWIRQAILQALADQSRVIRLPMNRVQFLTKLRKISEKLKPELGREPSPKEIAEESGLKEKEIKYTKEIPDSCFSLDHPSDPNNKDSNTLLDAIDDTSQPPPDKEVIDGSLRLEIKRALDKLTIREAEVITLHFGLNYEGPLNFEKIGLRLNLTRERIRQIEKKAIEKLKHPSRSEHLRDYCLT